MLCLKQAPQAGWLSPEAGVLFAASLAAGAWFVARSLRAGHPVVELRTLGDPAFALGCLLSFILGVVATAILLTLGGRLFSVNFGSPVAVGVLVVAAVIAATSLMFVIARVARTAEQANIAQSIIALVLGIAGGAFFTITASGWVGTVMDLNPVSAFIRGLGITSGGGGLGDIGTPLLILLGFTVIVLVIARLIPDRGATQ